MMQEKGLLIKGIGGFYTILAENGEEVIAKARGKFRIEGITPVCGDRVFFERQQEGHALLTDILARKNLLTRPNVANIDQLVIVLSASTPKADLLLCDKLLLCAYMCKISPLILINKIDEESVDTQTLMAEYMPHYPIMAISTLTREGMQPLSDALACKVSCFAGQSAVGKSSILNMLLPLLDLPVGGLAKRTARGRHTTRQSELWPYRGGALLDTPGFSLLELSFMDQDTINAAYREFGEAPNDCRFACCVHRNEPDCAVKALIGNGLAPGRYERYLALLAQIEELRKHQYD